MPLRRKKVSTVMGAAITHVLENADIHCKVILELGDCTLDIALPMTWTNVISIDDSIICNANVDEI